MILKPKLKFHAPTVGKKPTEILEPNQTEIVSNLSCKWQGNFPYKPDMKAMQCIDNEDDLIRLCEKLMEVPAFAFDTETNTLKVLADDKNFKFVGISFSWGEDNNYYIPVGHMRDEDLDNQLTLDTVVLYLQDVFEREDVKIYGWNLKFDLHVLKRIGIDVKTRDMFDGMLASWLCDENTPNGLKENSMSKLGISQTHFKDVTDSVPNEIKKRFGYKANSKVTFDLVLIFKALKYTCGDAFYTWCNCLGFEKELVKEGMDKIYYNMTMPFMFVLFDMEEQGVEVDVDKLTKMGLDMEHDIEELQYRIYELAGVEFNIGSTQQKAELLFGYRKPDIPVMRDNTPKAVSDILQRYKEGGFADKEECKQALEKKGFYTDEWGKIFKRANVNENILKHAFTFKPVGTTASGAPSTDSDAIWTISQMYISPRNKRRLQGVEMCKLLLEYSKLSKLKTAFVDGILEQLYADGKAHPSFMQNGTDSGRISCRQPNLQQLPKADEEDKYQIRDVFIGSEYVADAYTGEYLGEITDFDRDTVEQSDEVYIDRKYIIALDYHNLEMVCLAHFSGDENLNNMFANDDDAHGSTACNMFSLDCTPNECKKKYPHLRQAAKVINFMLMYGGGASTLYTNLKSDHYSPLDLGEESYLKEYGCKDGKQVAQAFIDKYFESYSGVASFIRNQKRFAHKNGYVYTILGRKRRLPDINSDDMAKSSYCERLAVNSAIQGTAGDITINAQIRVDKEEALKKMGCKMIIQVHDELVFECPGIYVNKAIEIIKYDMEHPFGDNPKKMVKFLRADADAGLSYQEAK